MRLSQTNLYIHYVPSFIELDLDKTLSLDTCNSRIRCVSVMWDLLEIKRNLPTKLYTRYLLSFGIIGGLIALLNFAGLSLNLFMRLWK